MKRVLAIAVLALALLGGCATRERVRVPAEVLVPADASPTVEMPTCPVALAPATGASAAEVVRTALEIITEQRACIARLKLLLAPYTPYRSQTQPEQTK